jgi:hypothetical protein
MKDEVACGNCTEAIQGWLTHEGLFGGEPSRDACTNGLSPWLIFLVANGSGR